MAEKVTKRILVVDDEPNIVSAVRRELGSPPFVRYRYAVEGFTDPAQALARAEEQEFDAVISDFRMPGLDGIEFLKRLAKIQPDCARLVLSGQTDMDSLIRLINETHIYRFVPKPWHDYYLKGSVAQALDYTGTLAEHRRLASFVRGKEGLAPVLPGEETDRILIVDDDPGILASLSRVLTRHSQMDDLFAAIRAEVAPAGDAVLAENRIAVQATPSPREALKLAETTRFSCIVADFRIPEMNGIELLQQFSDLQPDCQRILISGQISEDDLVYAVDSAHIFAFVDKPWTDFELKASIALALARRRLLLDNRLLADMVKKSSHIAPD